MKGHLRKLIVDLPIDVDDLASPPPNGATFNWKTLQLELPVQSSENMTPLVPMTRFALVRSPALAPEEWAAAALGARKALSLESSLKLAEAEAEKLSDDVELAGEGE